MPQNAKQIKTLEQPPSDENRTPEQLHKDYLVERELADRLRRATRSERQQLYSTVYDELFRQIPDHPQLTRKNQRPRRRPPNPPLRLRPPRSCPLPKRSAQTISAWR